MHNFRRKNHSESPRQSSRQSMDGFFSAPSERRNAFGDTPRTPRPAFRRSVFQDRLHGSRGGRRSLISDIEHPKHRKESESIFAGRRVSEGAVQDPVVNQHPKGHQPRQSHFRKHVDTEPAGKRSRLPFCRKRDRKQRPTWKKWALRGSLGLFLVMVAIVGFLIASGYLNLSRIFQGGGAAVALEGDVDPSKLRGEGDGRVNILLLGRGGTGHDGPDLTDTILVASIDPVNNKAALLSIPRDIWVRGKYSESKINAVFANAKYAARAEGKSDTDAEKEGVRATEKVVEDILGINMHYYGLIDFKGFEKAVNTVGGVTMNVPEELRDPTMAWENNWNPVLAKKGTQKMSGKQALMYVRSRNTSTRGDFDRAERQRLFIMALKNEIMSAGTFGNPVKVSRLMSDFGNHAKTDFSLNDLMRLYSISKDINKMDSISLVDEPNVLLTTGPYAGQSVVMPKAGMFSYEDIRLYVRKKLPDGYILKENAPVVILNGSTIDALAKQKADELRSYSYNVRRVENAPTQNHPRTILVDLTGKNKYTQNYLERRLGVKAVTKLPDGITLPEEEPKGFVIIIGQNEATSR